MCNDQDDVIRCTNGAKVVGYMWFRKFCSEPRHQIVRLGVEIWLETRDEAAYFPNWHVYPIPCLSMN